MIARSILDWMVVSPFQVSSSIWSRQLDRRISAAGV